MKQYDTNKIVVEARAAKKILVETVLDICMTDPLIKHFNGKVFTRDVTLYYHDNNYCDLKREQIRPLKNITFIRRVRIRNLSHGYSEIFQNIKFLGGVEFDNLKTMDEDFLNTCTIRGRVFAPAITAIPMNAFTHIDLAGDSIYMENVTRIYNSKFLKDTKEAYTISLDSLENWNNNFLKNLEEASSIYLRHLKTIPANFLAHATVSRLFLSSVQRMNSRCLATTVIINTINMRSLKEVKTLEFLNASPDITTFDFSSLTKAPKDFLRSHKINGTITINGSVELPYTQDRMFLGFVNVTGIKPNVNILKNSAIFGTLSCKTALTTGLHYIFKDCIARDANAYNECHNLVEVPCQEMPNGFTYDKYILLDHHVDTFKSVLNIGDYTIYHFDTYMSYYKYGSDLSYYKYGAIHKKTGYSAHGKTVHDAINDVKTKIAAEHVNDVYLAYDKDTKLTYDESIIFYRAVTGACRAGTESFLAEKGIVPDDKLYTLAEIIKYTERQYGSLKFKEFCMNKLTNPLVEDDLIE